MPPKSNVLPYQASIFVYSSVTMMHSQSPYMAFGVSFLMVFLDDWVIWDAFSLVLHSLVSPVNMFVRQKNVLNALFFIVYPV